MGRVRFIKPAVERLPLSDGDWIEIKRELSVGEKKDMQAAAFRDVNAKGIDNPGEARVGIDFAAYGFARAIAYLTDWSFRDHQDKPVVYSPDALKALSEESFKEIESAITAYLKAREEEKKATSGEGEPATT